MALKKLKEKTTALIKKFKELQGSPSYLAKGVAIGVFIAIMPVTPLKTALILLLSFLISSSAVAGILTCASLCNPFTYIPLYYLAWAVGNALMPGRATWQILESTLEEMQNQPISQALATVGQVGMDTIIVLLLGGCVVALPLALLSYPLAFRLFSNIAIKRSGKAAA